MALAEKINDGMKKHLDKHKASKKKESSKKSSTPEVNKSGDVERFEVHPIKGGHLLTTHKKTAEMGHYEEPERSAHKTMSSLHKEMKSQCGCGICAGGESDSGKAVDEED